MIAHRIGDFRVDALIERVVTPHQALQFGKLTDHATDKIDLGKKCRELCLFRIGADRLGDLASQGLDTADAFGLASRAWHER